VLVRPLSDHDLSWKDETLRRFWGSTVVARRGELVDTAGLPGFVVSQGEQRVGLLTYACRGDEMEIVTIHVEREGRGAGRALMDAALAHARAAGARRLWLSTTNDNLRALRFYQRWGMDLVGLVRDGVAASRRAKPSIPAIGRDDIPLRHELELELRLDPGAAGS
jgi:ribosomal protein S18 acetylase RimI-like enzyme